MRLGHGQIRRVVAKEPTILFDMLADPDPAKFQRVMEAMLKMRKIDVEALQRAYAQTHNGITRGRLRDNDISAV